MGFLPSHFGSTCSWLQAQREHVGVGAFTPDRSFKRYAEFELSTRLRPVLRCKLNFDLGLFQRQVELRSLRPYDGKCCLQVFYKLNDCIRPIDDIHDSSSDRKDISHRRIQAALIMGGYRFFCCCRAPTELQMGRWVGTSKSR